MNEAYERAKQTYASYGVDVEKALKILEKKKQKKEIKYIEIAKHLGVSKQDFNYHLKNLRKNKNTFSADQIKEISKYLGEDISIFFE